jgi:hypothetical protein
MLMTARARTRRHASGVRIMKMILALLASTAIFAAAPARAQAPATGTGWSSWIGCWELVRENVREGAAAASPAPAAAGGGPRVCVAAAGEDAVTLTTTIQGQPALEQTLVADGADHSITDDNCRGSQRAQWSADRLRLYARAELTCAGDATARSVSGLALIAPDGTWLDIQAVSLGARESTRVRRYRRATGDGVQARRYNPGTPFTLQDVKEAAARVSPRVIEAALVETRAGFDLTSRQMLDLSEAQVPASILDLLVALSYPKHFVVERADRPEPALLANDSYLLGWAYGSPFLGYDDGFFYPNYYYTPFAYSYAGRYFGSYGFYEPGFTVVDGASGGGSTEPQPSGTGRVVNGLGYTRVRPRESEPAQQAAGSSSGRGRATASGDTPSSTTTSSSGSGATASPQGYSGGGSGDGGGRTAQPR